MKSITNLPLELIEKILWNLDTKSYCNLAKTNRDFENFCFSSETIIKYLRFSDTSLWSLICDIDLKKINILQIVHMLLKRNNLDYFLPFRGPKMFIALRKMIACGLDTECVFLFEYGYYIPEIVNVLFEYGNIELAYFLIFIKKSSFPNRLKNLSFLLETNKFSSSSEKLFSLMIRGLNKKEINYIFPLVIQNKNTFFWEVLINNYKVSFDQFSLLFENKKKKLLTIYMTLFPEECLVKTGQFLKYIITNQDYDLFEIFIEYFPYYPLSVSMFNNISDVRFFNFLKDKYGFHKVIYDIMIYKPYLSSKVAKLIVDNSDPEILSSFYYSPELKYCILDKSKDISEEMTFDLPLMSEILSNNNIRLWKDILNNPNFPTNEYYHQLLVQRALKLKAYDCIYIYSKLKEKDFLKIVRHYLTRKDIYTYEELEILNFVSSNRFSEWNLILTSKSTIKKYILIIPKHLEDKLKKVNWYIHVQDEYKFSYLKYIGYNLYYI